MKVTALFFLGISLLAVGISLQAADRRKMSDSYCVETHFKAVWDIYRANKGLKVKGTGTRRPSTPMPEAVQMSQPQSRKLRASHLSDQ